MALAHGFTLANLFFISLNIGGSGAKFLVITISIGNGPPIQYDLLQLLLVLGISIVAAVILEALLHRATPGGIFGAFITALIGIWLFITFVPLVWKGDYYIDGIPLITALIGAILSILVIHLIAGPHEGWHRRRIASA